jgi:hypothetical protein
MSDTLETLASDVLDDGRIDADEVERLRDVIYEDGLVDRDEADMLFDLNDATVGTHNDEAWGDLFVEAVASHVLDDDESPGVVDDEEADWLIERIEEDDQVDSNELALLLRIAEDATGGAADSLTDATLDAAREAFLADGVIDDEEVDQIRTIVYGSGGSSGARVDRTEAHFLFDLNDAVTGESNTDAWPELFVEAIASHVLDDEESPGAVDEDEAEWLRDRIEGDDTYDATERQLLAEIVDRAESLPDTVEFDLDLSDLD